MSSILLLGMTTAIGAFTLLMLAPVKKSRLLGYVWLYDVCFSVLVVLSMMGTFSGVVTAFVAGLVFSALTRCARYWYGSATFDFRRFRWSDSDSGDVPDAR